MNMLREFFRMLVWSLAGALLAFGLLAFGYIFTLMIFLMATPWE